MRSFANDQLLDALESVEDYSSLTTINCKGSKTRLFNQQSYCKDTEHTPLYNAEFTTPPARATPRPNWPIRLKKLAVIVGGTTKTLSDKVSFWLQNAIRWLQLLIKNYCKISSLYFCRLGCVCTESKICRCAKSVYLKLIVNCYKKSCILKSDIAQFKIILSTTSTSMNEEAWIELNWSGLD